MSVLFEDESILVVDKPAGQIVHPAPGHEAGALTDELVAHCPTMRGVGSESRPGVVHRLDQDTSGVMVFAKTQEAYLNLRRQFESHKDIRKTYLAVCHVGSGGKSFAPRDRNVASPLGNTTEGTRHSCRVGEKGTLDSLIGRDHLRAISHYEVLGRQGPVALIRFDIETGRMHQIRIHAKEMGHPLVGDPLYGDAAADRRLKRKPRRTLLHAVELSFLHPKTGRRVTFAAPPPSDIVYVG